MEFKNTIWQLVERIELHKDNLPTEEATKTTLIMPFIVALGYDVFNPQDVLPEMTCDVGTKKGEKIDYAIMQNGEPVILMECKHWKENLSLHDNQLLRYFNVSKAKFGVLTNGIEYRFYTDLEKENVMDEKPFLVVNLLDIKDSHIEELRKFRKNDFNINTILSTASELKHMAALKTAIGAEFANPSVEFVKYFGRQVYDGSFTQKVTEQFTVLVKRTINNYVNDMITDRLKAAMADTQSMAAEETTSIEEESADSGIITTDEELQAFYMIKAMLVQEGIPSARVAFRDAKSYFSILIDDNNRKTVCRLHLNVASNKRISFGAEQEKQKLQCLDDLYNLKDRLVAEANKYM